MWVASVQMADTGHKRSAEDEPHTADNDEEEIDLLAMLTRTSASRLNMKEAPQPNKRGKVNYYGYMDEYFKERPPVPVTNVVFDNETLRVVRDLTGSF